MTAPRNYWRFVGFAFFLLIVVLVFVEPTPPTVQAHAGNYDFLNVTQYTVPIGTLNYGNLTSLAFLDGKLMSIQEVAGTPGFDVRFNVTNVPVDAVALGVMGYWEYIGNPAHIVEGVVWNYTAGVWVNVGTFTDTGSMMWMNVSLSMWRPNDVMRNGTIRLRVDHVSPGNTGHIMLFDYVRVRVFVTPANSFLNPFVFVLIIMAMLAVFVVFKTGRKR